MAIKISTVEFLPAFALQVASQSQIFKRFFLILWAALGVAPLAAEHSGAALDLTAGESMEADLGLPQPVSLAVGDFDGDGLGDVVVGYRWEAGGSLVLFRREGDGLVPMSSAQPIRELEAGDRFTPISRFEVPTAPDVLAAGFFTRDSVLDVVVAARGGSALLIYAGDQRGHLSLTRTIVLPGELTALEAGEINRRDGLTDLVVGVVSQQQPKVLVFESPAGLAAATPEALPLPARATDFALGFFDGDTKADLAVAAGRSLVLVRGRDRRLTLEPSRRGEVPPAQVRQLVMSQDIVGVTAGELDGAFGHEIAGALHNGSVVVWERPFSGTEASAARAASVVATLPPGDAGRRQLMTVAGGNFGRDDLLVFESVAGRVDRHVMGSSSSVRERHESVTGELIGLAATRVNTDALDDLVFLTSRYADPLEIGLSQAASTFVVTTVADHDDGACDMDCTLRESINAANLSPGADVIDFSGLPPGDNTILPLSELPTITDPVTLDATTLADGRVELAGFLAPMGTNGLVITAGSSIVRGLVVNFFGGDGIRIEGNGGNLIEGSFIGTNLDGDAALGNLGHGIHCIGSPNLTIGGRSTGAGNLVSGNGDFLGEILIFGNGASGAVVEGNYVGSDVTGGQSLGSARGLSVQIADLATIGGLAAGAGNLFSGNGSQGIIIQSSDASLIQANLIGTDPAGTAANPNEFGGILAELAPDTTIGGTAAAAGNLISGNGDIQRAIGVFLTALCDGTLIQGNFVGTDITGTVALGNDEGIRNGGDSNGVTIGGAVPGAGNVVSGNRRIGVRANVHVVGTQDVVIQGNLIGTAANGVDPLGNSGAGISIQADGSEIEDIVIGSTIVSDAGNTIAFNNGFGVQGNDTGLGISIHRNSMFGNIQGGIDIGAGANDPGDGDTGFNRRQNHPDLLSARIQNGGDLVVSYFVDSLPVHSPYPLLIELFEADSAVSRQGRVFLGTHVFTVDDLVAGMATVNLGSAAALGIDHDDPIVSTATDAEGSTSEFSEIALVSSEIFADGFESGDLSSWSSSSSSLWRKSTTALSQLR